ncbi:hypothetical protein G4B88_002953 [Cannabis sativa]|uniref:RanBP2-type domain-containing protein n=1 Tax=Cannabis sativa TaxID=3483 RepID=A0A7J6FJY9_CANSA|nr:hypothetical protein G4B88_002953 [Cannabis sativa]
MGGATNRFFALLSSSTTTTTTSTAAAPLPILFHRYSSLLIRLHRRPKLSLLLHSSTRTHFLTLSHSSAPKTSRLFHSHVTASSSLHDNFPDSSIAGASISWPEWSSLVNALSSAGYFNRSQGFSAGEDELLKVEELSEEFTRAARACLEFARERPKLIRLLPRRDVEVVIGNGTPFLFKDADNSVQKLKSFASNGESKSNVLDMDKVSTVDLMKFILSYASNFVSSSESNNFYNRELVEPSIRNLLRELTKLCTTIPDSTSFGSVQSQFAGNNGQSRRPFGQNIEMKRGDWICSRCSFMNFAKNIKCLECEEARPKRQLTGGEWECPQCDFFNYGSNLVCLRCDCKRPGGVSVGPTNTRPPVAYESANNSNKAEIDSRLAANEEKAQRWFSKISQLDSTSDMSSAIADDDFPEIMPLRKGVNRFVVSTRKTPLERRLANSRYQTNLGNNGTTEGGQPQGRNSGYVPFVPLPADMFVKKPENTQPEDLGKVATGHNESAASNTIELSDNVSGSYESTKFKSEDSSQNQAETKENKEAEKSDRWYKKIAELHNVTDLASEISDEDFPEIMPMRKGENRFVVSKKKDRSLTSPAYKRQMAMDQASNTKFVPFVPFPPDYFAKKSKPQADGTDLSDKDAEPKTPDSRMAEQVPEKLANNAKAGEHSKDRFQQAENHVGMPSWKSEASRVNISENNTGTTYGTPSNANFSQSSAKTYNSSNNNLSRENVRKETSNQLSNITESSPQSNNQNNEDGWTGKSLEGSAVKEPDPLDMSEEAKAERWFRRVAHIKDISELSQIPDEDFPSIMPMRKGVNRFVVSKRKTPLERRLTSPQYRRNLPIVSSDPVKKETDNS